LSEQQFNKLGYDFLRSGKIPQALETFRINTELFPQSYNTFDSYGEALLKNNQREKALIMYQKSVELNPGNENGKKIIQDLIK
jgi:tetratricopeptide (TPR) repeat protein